MTIRTIRRLGILAVVLLAITVPMFAQSTSGPPPFVKQLITQLQKDGWSTAATAGLEKAASQLNWSGTNGADPQVVALALEYSAKTDSALTSTAQAQVALQLALSTVQMEQAGMSQQSAAAAALKAVQSSLADLQTAIADHTTGNSIGLIMRKAVSTAVRNQVQNSVGSQINSHASVGQGLAPNGAGGSYGPPSSTPGAPSGSHGGASGPAVR